MVHKLSLLSASILILLTLSSCQSLFEPDLNDGYRPRKKVRLKRSTASQNGLLQARKFDNPNFIQVVDSEADVVCYSRSPHSRGGGTISCVGYDSKNVNSGGRVIIDKVKDPYTLRIKDTKHRVVCYTHDDGPSKNASISCINY